MRSEVEMARQLLEGLDVSVVTESVFADAIGRARSEARALALREAAEVARGFRPPARVDGLSAMFDNACCDIAARLDALAEEVPDGR